MQDNSAKIFSDNWNLYQKVVQLNYMHHADFTKAVADVFNEFNEQVIDVLDIGCGDAGFLKPVLQNHSIRSYTGYDLSAPALQIASDNLSQSSFDVDLKQGDMLELIQQETKILDVIHAGFAIHHLQDEQKLSMWEACLKRLKPGGKFIYTDVFRQADADRDEYLRQYFSMMDNRWIGLNIAEKELIHNHVNQYDFPSLLDRTIVQLQQVGFSLLQKTGPDNFHIMLVLGSK